ncbi:MAG TPA: ATPase, partial [Thermoprotei archaeon]|nr:ATPase [Thermoprotei archaeon]
VIYLGNEEKNIFLLEKFFEEDVMSVHLKENVLPYVKRGVPGKWKFETIRNTPISRKELEEIIRNIFEISKDNNTNMFIEADRLGSTIIQLKNYRIVITRPPFSDGLEVTAVRPVRKLSIYDYNIPKKLFLRLDEKAEGILVAGAPGMGKTTFVQALAEYYTSKGRVVKTIEAPRDMQLPNTITQYSKNYASSEEIHDVLLLSRPDYTVFDEMRDTKDFELFADLRLAGVGMIGVIHATTAIDAIQRFIGRVELGVIPSIIDTVIFIENGAISKVYEVTTAIKVPYGLKEEDLARPVVVVSDFLTGEPEYELYVFGERTFVVPIRRRKVKSISGKVEVLKKAIVRSLKKYIVEEDIDIEIIDENRVIVYIDAEYLSIIPGKSRRKLERIGRKMGVKLEVKPRFSAIT